MIANNSSGTCCDITDCSCLGLVTVGKKCCSAFDCTCRGLFYSKYDKRRLYEIEMTNRLLAFVEDGSGHSRRLQVSSASPSSSCPSSSKPSSSSPTSEVAVIASNGPKFTPIPLLSAPNLLVLDPSAVSSK